MKLSEKPKNLQNSCILHTSFSRWVGNSSSNLLVIWNFQINHWFKLPKIFPVRYHTTAPCSVFQRTYSNSSYAVNEGKIVKEGLKDCPVLRSHFNNNTTPQESPFIYKPKHAYTPNLPIFHNIFMHNYIAKPHYFRNIYLSTGQFLIAAMFKKASFYETRQKIFGLLGGKIKFELALQPNTASTAKIQILFSCQGA